MPGPRDLGGANFCSIGRADHERRDHEKRIEAMQCTLRDRGYWCVNEMHRTIVALLQQEHLTFTCYQKRLSALHFLVKVKGLLDQEDIAQRISRLRTEISPR